MQEPVYRDFSVVPEEDNQILTETKSYGKSFWCSADLTVWREWIR